MEIKRDSWNYYSDEPIFKASGNSKTVLKIVAPLVCAFLFYFLYSSQFVTILYDKSLVFIPFLVVFILIPKMIIVTANVWIRSENIKAVVKFLGFISVLINGPFFGYWSGVAEERALSTSGVKTKAIVTRAWQSKGKRMYYDFYVNGKLYTSYNVSNPKNYKEGDSIIIIYNKNIPEMNEPL